MAKRIEKTVYTFKELIELADDPDSDVTQSAVEKARQWLQEGATDHDWYEYSIDMWKQALEQVGFENAEIQFSGFWSQGDGASFTADVDLDTLVEFMATEIEPKACIESKDGETDLFAPWVVHQIGGKRTVPRYRLFIGPLREFVDYELVRTDSRYSHEQTCHFKGSINDYGHYSPSKDGYGFGPWISRTPKVRKLFESFVDDVEELRRDLCHAIYKSLEQEYEYLTSDECLIENSEANKYMFDVYGDRDG